MCLITWVNRCVPNSLIYLCWIAGRRPPRQFRQSDGYSTIKLQLNFRLGLIDWLIAEIEKKRDRKKRPRFFWFFPRKFVYTVCSLTETSRGFFSLEHSCLQSYRNYRAVYTYPSACTGDSKVQVTTNQYYIENAYFLSKAGLAIPSSAARYLVSVVIHDNRTNLEIASIQTTKVLYRAAQSGKLFLYFGFCACEAIGLHSNAFQDHRKHSGST